MRKKVITENIPMVIFQECLKSPSISLHIPREANSDGNVGEKLLIYSS